MSAVSTARLIAAASITSSLAISDVPTNNWSICFLVALLVATAYNEILLFVAQTTSPKVLQAFTKHRSNNASEGGHVRVAGRPWMEKMNAKSVHNVGDPPFKGRESPAGQDRRPLLEM